MFKKCQLIMLFFTLLTFLFAINIAQAGTNQAAAYLESVQNPDGSWGSDPSTIYFETTETVKTLRSLGRTGSAYQRGVNFIANYEIGGVEDHARRVDAIEPAGKDTTDDVSLILAGIALWPALGWWGVAIALISIVVAILTAQLMIPAIMGDVEVQGDDEGECVIAARDSNLDTSVIPYKKQKCINLEFIFSYA